MDGHGHGAGSQSQARPEEAEACGGVAFQRGSSIAKSVLFPARLVFSAQGLQRTFEQGFRPAPIEGLVGRQWRQESRLAGFLGEFRVQRERCPSPPPRFRADSRRDSLHQVVPQAGQQVRPEAASTGVYLRQVVPPQEAGEIPAPGPGPRAGNCRIVARRRRGAARWAQAEIFESRRGIRRGLAGGAEDDAPASVGKVALPGRIGAGLGDANRTIGNGNRDGDRWVDRRPDRPATSLAGLPRRPTSDRGAAGRRRRRTRCRRNISRMFAMGMPSWREWSVRQDVASAGGGDIDGLADFRGDVEGVP